MALLTIREHRGLVLLCLFNFKFVLSPLRKLYSWDFSFFVVKLKVDIKDKVTAMTDLSVYRLK